MRHGELVAVSGISSARGGELITGKVGRDLSFDPGQRELHPGLVDDAPAV